MIKTVKVGDQTVKLGDKVLWSGNPKEVGWVTELAEDAVKVYFQGASGWWGAAVEFPGTWTVVAR